jgi:peptidoglycan/xylan/chitin deacetylase (PgdA/CDA1 family)
VSESRRGNPNWPSGHRAALCLTFDVDGIYGEANYQDPANTYMLSQTEYDPVGTVRILELLEDYGVQATFCWVGKVAEERPDLVRRAHDSGHEIAMHTWTHRYLNQLTDEEQLEDFERTFEALRLITGVAPVGHKSGGWRYNSATHLIAQQIGLNWVMDIPNGDLPDIMQLDPERQRLVNLPPSFHYDDYAFFVDKMLTPAAAYDFWHDDLEVIRTEGGLMCLTMHPFVSGRPGPSRAITRLLDYAVDLGDVWIARADHIARWWLERERQITGPESNGRTND